MTKITATRKIRDYFAKNGKRLDSLPLETKYCAICSKAMLVADGSNTKYHKCCRKFRNKIQDAWMHVQDYHGAT